MIGAGLRMPTGAGICLLAIPCRSRWGYRVIGP
jgi:hypothetical protein